jgi:uncharacterized protein YkwD
MHASRFLLAAVGSLFAAGCTVPMSGATPPAAAAPASGTSRYSSTESRIFDLINAERRRQGLSPVVYNPQLDRMAKIQAENMARFQKMSHNLPESSLPTLGDRARYVGYTFGRIEENVALGYPDAESVVRGWMSSTGHRRNILDRNVSETGIGIARSSAGGLYFCQVFGKQL